MLNSTYSRILATIADLAGRVTETAPLEKAITAEIAAQLPKYHWVGFYWLDPADAEMLVLGAFVGAPTDHTHIPIHRGICGAAVAEEQTIVIDDVHADPRYLSCSIETKSEIVVPVRVHGKIVGEIDIDSHEPAAFDASDREFLERICSILGGFMESHPA